MKGPRLFCSLLFLLVAVICGPAFAERGHFHSGHFHSGHFHHGPRVGVVIGAPLLWWPGPFYGPYDYYPYPPVAAVPAEPPVYIEQSHAEPLAPGYWYYCSNPAGYYPDVRQCAGGWQQVAPRAPATR